MIVFVATVVCGFILNETKPWLFNSFTLLSGNRILRNSKKTILSFTVALQLCDDASICKAVNLVIKEQGGVSAVASSPSGGGQEGAAVLGLPVAGLMSNEDGYKVAADYTAIDKMTKVELGSTLAAPFMTLSFMALLVIPHLKLSDLGLFDGDKFEFVK